MALVGALKVVAVYVVGVTQGTCSYRRRIQIYFQEPGELFREPRPFCYHTGIYIQHATAAIRTELAPATDVQDQLLVAYREVIQDCFLGEHLRRVVLRLFGAVVSLIKVQMKCRDLGFGRRVYVCLLLCHDGLEEVKQPVGKKVMKEVFVDLEL